MLQRNHTNHFFTRDNLNKIVASSKMESVEDRRARRSQSQLGVREALDAVNLRYIDIRATMGIDDVVQRLEKAHNELQIA